jgi:hypothetical protein
MSPITIGRAPYTVYSGAHRLVASAVEAKWHQGCEPCTELDKLFSEAQDLSAARGPTREPITLYYERL